MVRDRSGMPAIPVVGGVVTADIDKERRDAFGPEVLGLVIADQQHSIGLRGGEAAPDLAMRIADGGVAPAVVLQGLGARCRGFGGRTARLARHVRLGALAAGVPSFRLLERISMGRSESADQRHIAADYGSRERVMDSGRGMRFTAGLGK